MNKAHEKYLRKATRIALKSGCLRTKTGAVLVRKNQVLIQAHGLVLPEEAFCQEKGCLRDKLKLGLGREAEKCRSIHAEAWAISLAAKKGVSLLRATAYLTCQPCINCAKLLFTAGVKTVFFLDRHADQTGTVFLEKVGMECERVKLKGDDPQKRLRDVRGQL